MDLTLHLPSETLCYIFHFARLANPNPTSDEIHSARAEVYQRYSSRGRAARMQVNLSQFMFAWLALTHVCSRWRVLALGDTQLWTDVPGTLGPEWAGEFVARSGQQPVSIDWASADTGLREYLQDEVAPAHFQRMRNYHADLDASNQHLVLLSLAWPELEELALELTGSVSLHTLIDVRVPRLRCLKYCVRSATYHCHAFPWHIEWLKQLAVLDISFTDGIFGRSMSDLMDALSRMPHLRHLRLGGHAPPRASDVLERCTYCHHDSSRLQHIPLKTLVLHCNWTMITHVMSHIVPPPSARIVLDPHGHYDEREMDPEITEEQMGQSVRDAFTRIQGWRTQMQGARAASYAALKLTVGRTDIERVLVSSSRDIPGMPPPRSWHTDTTGIHPDLEYHPYIVWDWNNNGAALAPTHLIPFLRVVAPDSIRILSVCSEDRELHLDWLTDSVFKHIEVLRLPSPSVLSLSAFSEAMNATGDGENDVELFPALKILDFHECKLAELQRPECMAALQKLSSRHRDGSGATEDAGVVIYLRVASEVWRVHKGQMGKTSLKGLTRDQATSQILDVLKAMRGVRIIERDAAVSYDVH